MELSLAKKGTKRAANTLKPWKRTTTIPWLTEALKTQSRNQRAMGKGHAASETDQACPTNSHATTQQDSGGPTAASTYSHSLCLTDFQATKYVAW